MFALIEKDHFLADDVVVSLLHVVEANSVGSELEKLGDQISD